MHLCQVYKALHQMTSSVVSIYKGLTGLTYSIDDYMLEFTKAQNRMELNECHNMYTRMLIIVIMTEFPNTHYEYHQESTSIQLVYGSTLLVQ